MSEEWRPVVGWEGLYEVSSFGRVRRVTTSPGARAGHVLKPWLGVGYPKVQLYGPTRRKEFVHRIVAMAFIGPPPTAQHQVNHIDGDRLRAEVTNLEWATGGENSRHAVGVLGHGRTLAQAARGEGHGMAKLTDAAVREIRMRSAAGERHRDIAASLSVHQDTVTLAARGKTWRHVR